MRLTQPITAGLHVGAYVVIGLALCGLTAQAAESTEPVFYRIFLADGSTLVSYGEYSRVGDQVIFIYAAGCGSGRSALALGEHSLCDGRLDDDRALRGVGQIRTLR